MKLYDYFRSTACYRVRIALNIKNIAYEKIEIHLVNHGGEQNSPEYHQINPQGLVPSLEINGQFSTNHWQLLIIWMKLFRNTFTPQRSFNQSQIKSLALIVPVICTH